MFPQFTKELGCMECPLSRKAKSQLFYFDTVYLRKSLKIVPKLFLFNSLKKFFLDNRVTDILKYFLMKF